VEKVEKGQAIVRRAATKRRRRFFPAPKVPSHKPWWLKESGEPSVSSEESGRASMGTKAEDSIGLLGC
jgi:hypothetical protein